jgi:membrane dipeptidase
MIKLALLLAVACAVFAQTKVDPARVTRLLQRAVLIDLHDDTTQMIVDEGYNLAEKHDFGQVDIPRMRAGHISGLFLSIWTDPDRYTPTEAVRRALEEIDAVRRETARHPADLEPATTADEILSAKKRGHIAILMGVEGGQAIDSDLSILRTYFELGARYMTLTHTNHTPWADTSSKPPEHNGLTDFGKQVVREMNRLGMMVDISHVSDKTFYRTLIISRAPVIASHSSARALCDVPRNMTDDMLRAVAHSGGPDSKGGVVQVNFYSGFLSQAYRYAQNAMKPEVNKAVQAAKDKAKAEGREATYQEISKIEKQYADRIPRPPLSLLIDHIDHIAKVAGVDHVGLGSDFDGVNDQLPEGMDSPADLPKITTALMERGYSAEDCRKILGGNLMRVFREVEQVAKQLQAEDRPRISDKQPFDKPRKP